MGSVRFDCEGKLQPSSISCDFKKHKSSKKKLLIYCNGVSYDSVPRKLRSAIKKRGHECISLPLPISRKQRCLSNGVEKLRKNCPKESRQIMKNGYVTKDEEEVAETLYALADMFGTSKPVTDEEPSKIAVGSSISAAKDTGILKVQNESEKTDTRIIVEAASHSSSLVNPTAQVVESQSSFDSEQPKLETSTPEVQSYLSPSPRQKISKPNMIRSFEKTINRNQIQYPQVVLERRSHVPPMGSDFSSLAAGGNGSNTIGCSNRARYSLEASKQPDGPYPHLQKLSGMHFSFPNSRYSTFDNRTPAEAAALQKRCAATPHIRVWQDGGRDSTSRLNYAQALFPPMHSALGSKYQQERNLASSASHITGSCKHRETLSSPQSRFQEKWSHIICQPYPAVATILQPAPLSLCFYVVRCV